MLEAGRWQGRGSYRPADQALGVAFTAEVDVTEDRARNGFQLDATLQVEGAAAVEMLIWIAADETGTYAVTVHGAGVNALGTAKMESEPHLGLLWSEAGDLYVAWTLFALPETHGLRGFARQDGALWTWELALDPPRRVQRQQEERSGNVISLATRRPR